MAYDFTKEQVLKAIEGSFGIMSNVARGLGGVEWHTAKTWVNTWECTKQAYKDQRERFKDLCEMRGGELVNEKDGPMIRFFLATIAKDRGYTTQTEISGPGGGPVPVTYVEVVKPTETKSDGD